jgi:hypothetical protein
MKNQRSFGLEFKRQPVEEVMSDESCPAQAGRGDGTVLLSNDDHYLGCLDLGRDYPLRSWIVKDKGFA